MPVETKVGCTCLKFNTSFFVCFYFPLVNRDIVFMVSKLYKNVYYSAKDQYQHSTQSEIISRNITNSPAMILGSLLNSLKHCSWAICSRYILPSPRQIIPAAGEQVLHLWRKHQRKQKKSWSWDLIYARCKSTWKDSTWRSQEQGSQHQWETNLSVLVLSLMITSRPSTDGH